MMRVPHARIHTTMRSVYYVLVALLVACGGGGDSVTAPDSIVGTWRLASINGGPVPITIFELDATKWSARTMTLNDRGETFVWQR